MAGVAGSTHGAPEQKKVVAALRPTSGWTTMQLDRAFAFSAEIFALG